MEVNPQEIKVKDVKEKEMDRVKGTVEESNLNENDSYDAMATQHD